MLRNQEHTLTKQKRHQTPITILWKNPKLPYFNKINHKHVILTLSNINSNSKQDLNNKNNIFLY